jgi:hypothetical protein
MGAVKHPSQLVTILLNDVDLSIKQSSNLDQTQSLFERHRELRETPTGMTKALFKVNDRWPSSASSVKAAIPQDRGGERQEAKPLVVS